MNWYMSDTWITQFKKKKKINYSKINKQARYARIIGSAFSLPSYFNVQLTFDTSQP